MVLCLATTTFLWRIIVSNHLIAAAPDSNILRVNRVCAVEALARDIFMRCHHSAISIYEWITLFLRIVECMGLTNLLDLLRWPFFRADSAEPNHLWLLEFRTLKLRLVWGVIIIAEFLLIVFLRQIVCLRRVNCLHRNHYILASTVLSLIVIGKS